MVASFYELPDERDGLFWKAQQLASEDFTGAEDNAAFISIISGREDILESSDPARALGDRVRSLQRHVMAIMGVPDRMEKLVAMSPPELVELATNGMELDSFRDGRPSLTPESAVGALYVTPAPELGLRRVTAPSTSSAS